MHTLSRSSRKVRNASLSVVALVGLGLLVALQSPNTEGAEAAPYVTIGAWVDQVVIESIQYDGPFQVREARGSWARIHDNTAEGIWVNFDKVYSYVLVRRGKDEE